MANFKIYIYRKIRLFLHFTHSEVNCEYKEVRINTLKMLVNEALFLQLIYFE